MLPMAAAGVFGRTTMKWITREHPRVDRVACPWLVERFIDKQAEFIYVPSDQVAAEAQKRGATPYDIKDVELGHHGRVRAKVRARQGAGDGLHGQGHSRRGYRRQDDHPRVAGGRGDPRWDQARPLSERPETARGLATAPRRALRLLPEKGGGEGR